MVAGGDQIPRWRHAGMLRGGRLREPGYRRGSTASKDVVVGPYGRRSKRRRPFVRWLWAAQDGELPCEGEGEGNRVCEILELTMSMLAMLLGFKEDRSKDFNHGRHGRAQSSLGR